MDIIPNAVTRQVFKSALVLRKHAPTLMFVGGISGVVASTVLACKATLTLSDELGEMKKNLEIAKTQPLIQDEDRTKQVAMVYGLNAARVAQLYGPAVVIGGLSIGLLTGSHVTLTRRNSSLTAAYAVVNKAYHDYRERVRNELGDEKELDIYHGAQTHVVEIEGKKQKVKVVHGHGSSPYARFFDECSRNWIKNAEMNRLYVQCQQNYANQRLQARGYLFLNEVYDMLGLEITKEGQQVGWVTNNGDNFVDFGMFEAGNEDFLDGRERSVLLDFNVDGVILDLI